MSLGASESVNHGHGHGREPVGGKVLTTDRTSRTMSQFRAKRLDIGCFVNKWVIRDHTKRKVFAEYETERYVLPGLHLKAIGIGFDGAKDLGIRVRSLANGQIPCFGVCIANVPAQLIRQALRYVIRNTTLPARMRAEAQLKLHQMHCYTRPSQIVNRCIMGGRGKGVFRDVRMARVSSGNVLNFEKQATGAEASAGHGLIRCGTVSIQDERPARENSRCQEG
ncbi:hypothetical protein FKW77_009754 [Venturia effusa]|uniref:Uncharacterized protein n=1 Tax=Venturia effusa TaxID=50376 RepID=A0A517LBQ2_9PEZI|nr:hypothetical protein FKW77_009754 [Venturia effusa]